MKINIFYFSGTGFTERVGRGLTKEFINLDQDASLHYIPELIGANPVEELEKLGSSDMIGIMYPVHSFNAPEIVVKFARKLPEGHGIKAFIVKTAGDKSEINAGSSILLMRTLVKRGYQVTYEELVQMPTNFLVRYEDQFIKELAKNSDKLVRIIAEEIVKGRKKPVNSSLGKTVFAAATRVEWIGAHLLAKFYFKVDKSCNFCGVCIRDCPTKNIHEDEGRIKFGLGCTFCMRCIYGCPQKAIHIRKPFSAIEVKDWFDLEEMVKEEK